MIKIIILTTFILILILFITSNKLKKDIEYNPPDKKYPVITDQQREVLNIYYRSGIKIPYDILEELEYYSIDDKDQIFQFIENQRYSWKLENTKKPYK